MNSPYRSPDGLFFQLLSTRRAILACYCAIIIAATPLWWITTSIERLALNVDTSTLQPPRLPISIHAPAAFDLPRALNEEISRNPERWQGIDINTVDTPTSETYIIEESNGPVSVRGRKLLYPLHTRQKSDLIDILSSLLVPYALVQDKKHTVVQFSTRYRLAFSLLNEDGSEGDAIVNWDVEQAISQHITPILNSLSNLHNFTIESQVQFHAPLALQPRRNEDGSHGLTPEDLTVFFNSAEWTLSSSASNDPVLHFVLFVPSKSHRPLHILSANGDISQSKSFILPQWGGIVIGDFPSKTSLCKNCLQSPFNLFRSQLLTLLGVPSLPAGVSRVSSNSTLSEWQLDALLRRRTLENTRDSQETLKSIVRLVDQIENMPVGEKVRRDVQESLSSLQKLHRDSSLTERFRHSAQALVLSSRAFFSPGMLALLYFPAEHKYAVYTPLFASALIPIIGAVIRELSAWRRERREAVQSATR